MSNPFTIRLVTLEDVRQTLDIYRPFVEISTISFEYDVPTLEEWKSRISSYSSDYPWLVCEYGTEIVGYAYGSKHRSRTAYSWSVESTIYLSEKIHRKGVGKVLYETLFNLLRLQGYVNVYAGVTVPNEKSERFHLALGFYDVGTFKNIGFKFGKWHDTKWFQMHLTASDYKPAELKSVKEITETLAFEETMAAAQAKL